MCDNAETADFFVHREEKVLFHNFPFARGARKVERIRQHKMFFIRPGKKLNILRKHNAGTMVRQKADANFPHGLFGWQNSRYVQVFQGSQPFTAQKITGAALRGKQTVNAIAVKHLARVKFGGAFQGHIRQNKLIQCPLHFAAPSVRQEKPGRNQRILLNGNRFFIKRGGLCGHASVCRKADFSRLLCSEYNFSASAAGKNALCRAEYRRNRQSGFRRLPVCGNCVECLRIAAIFLGVKVLRVGTFS